MAYDKQTWIAREGTALNRFLKANENASSVELTNDPTAVTVEGTPFTADRMNHMENGIYDVAELADAHEGVWPVGEIYGTPVEIQDLDRFWLKAIKTSSGDIYAIAVSQGIFKQTGGTGSFVLQSSGAFLWKDICEAPNGDIYACINSTSGGVYKQTGGTGSFTYISAGLGYIDCRAIAADGAGNIYIAVSGTSKGIYKLTGGAGSFVKVSMSGDAALQNWTGMVIDSFGNLYATASGGLYIQEAGQSFPSSSSYPYELVGLYISPSNILYGTYNYNVYTLDANDLELNLTITTGLATTLSAYYDLGNGVVLAGDNTNVYKLLTDSVEVISTYNAGTITSNDDGQIYIFENGGSPNYLPVLTGNTVNISDDLVLPSLSIGSRKRILASADVTVTMPSGETLDGASTVSLLNGQFVEVEKVTSTQWKRTGSNIPDVPVSTSSRIFDLTGDRVPPIPDDPAGVTYLQDAWATTDGWSAWASSATLAAESTQLKITGNGGNSYVAIQKTGNSLGKLHVVKTKINRNVTQIGYYNGAIVQYATPIIVGGYMYGYFYTLGSYTTNYTVFFNFGRTTTTSDIVEVLEIYIGTGAYLSKTVDRAGVPWTNVGALPIAGPFGRGLQFNGAQYMQAPGPMIGTTGTVAFSLSASEFTRNMYPLGNRSATGGFGTFIALTTGAMGVNFRKTDGTIYDIPIGTLTVNGRIECVVTYDSSNIKVFKGGALYTTVPIVVPLGGVSTNVFEIGKQPDVGIGNSFIGTIYAIRADSRVWTDEEIARWSRDPYSEDSGLIDAFSLSFANLPTFADNAAAIAGNLPAGKLYKTSTGNVLVRY